MEFLSDLSTRRAVLLKASYVQYSGRISKLAPFFSLYELVQVKKSDKKHHKCLFFWLKVDFEHFVKK